MEEEAAKNAKYNCRCCSQIVMDLKCCLKEFVVSSISSKDLLKPLEWGRNVDLNI